MDNLTGNYDFVKASVNSLADHFEQSTDQAKTAVATAFGLTDAATIAARVTELAGQFAPVRESINTEAPLPYVHYASRAFIVGLYQSALSKVFKGVPALQGEGNLNPAWATTILEEVGTHIVAFFHHLGHHTKLDEGSIMARLVEEWSLLSYDKAPYPPDTPKVQSMPNECNVALLADWGGDNPAARAIANLCVNNKPEIDIAIHLGDIYYGGSKWECEAFLEIWPTRLVDSKTIKPHANFALNGNHEMYSGGKHYFDTVLPAFGQPQPFFCLENDFWRIIGLDTAYTDGRLKPVGEGDPLNSQWDWLIDTLKRPARKPTILLTHHQPVSAHEAEFGQAQGLREDIKALLATPGIGEDAIFGWFFGHEHRCAIYDDNATLYNARLIGSGCIPHKVQQEVSSDPGCTPARYFNKRAVTPGSETAVSMYVRLEFHDNMLTVVYTDQDNATWGVEQWYSDRSRHQISPFTLAPAGVFLGTSQG